ncbi:MAG: element excision factor XisI family protein [Leptolyngbyaceae bacterium]|nr:element excision factor XisI family protein [Leptolyngbyaceae bacterium]
MGHRNHLLIMAELKEPTRKGKRRPSIGRLNLWLYLSPPQDEKNWIQGNGTEDDLAQELVELGVPKTDIVIGFHAPELRKYTEYAVS